MEIIQVSHTYRPSIGGIENYTHRLKCSLEDAGHSVSILTTTQSLENEHSPLEPAPDTEYCKTTLSFLRNPFSIELYRQVQESDADLYHLHSPWFLPALEAVHALPDETPIVMTIHGFQPYRTAVGRVLERAYRPFASYILDRVDQTITLGDSERRRLVDEYHVAPQNVSVVPNGIHPDRHDVPPAVVDHFRAKYGIDPDRPTILYVSRLYPLKNQLTLVDAVTRHLPDLDANVVIVGTGDRKYARTLRRRADDRFTFLSNLPFEHVQAAYHAADAFVLLSECEGLPTVVLEAMNAGLPIVTTPAGALADVITHEETGWVLGLPPDERELARAIRHVVHHPAEWRTVGKRNRDYVRSQFDWDRIAAEIEAVYERLLDTQSVASGPAPVRPRGNSP